MLENSVWRQYNDTKTIAQALSTIYGVEPEALKEDEGALYASLKRHLTKRELKFFALKEAGYETEAILSALEMDAETLDKTARKVNRKVKQEKIMSEVQAVDDFLSK